MSVLICSHASFITSSLAVYLFCLEFFQGTKNKGNTTIFVVFLDIYKCIRRKDYQYKSVYLPLTLMSEDLPKMKILVLSIFYNVGFWTLYRNADNVLPHPCCPLNIVIPYFWSSWAILFSQSIYVHLYKLGWNCLRLLRKKKDY